MDMKIKNSKDICKIEKVNRFGEILEVTNSSDLLLLEIRMRSKLIHKLIDLKIMKESENVEWNWLDWPWGYGEEHCP